MDYERVRVQPLDSVFSELGVVVSEVVLREVGVLGLGHGLHEHAFQDATSVVLVFDFVSSRCRFQR